MTPLLAPPAAAPADLSTLAWVVDELRRTLENANKALRRQVRETEAAPPATAIDGAAAPSLQLARALLHQGAGALAMVGEAEGTRMLHASEQAVVRLAQDLRKLDGTAATTIERASFALLDYLRRRLAGKDVSPLAMFPQYRDVQALAGADRVHPADLWQAGAAAPAAQLADAAPALLQAAAGMHAMPRQPDADTLGRMEQCMLALLRGPVAPAAAQMSQLFAGLAAGTSGKLSGLWSLAAAFFEAQAQGRLPADIYGKRLTSRLLAQVRLAERGQSDISDRLAQDLLFFCARALPADDASTPRLAATHRAFALQPLPPVDYEQEALGRYDPALIPQAHRRVEALKESWSSVTAGQPGHAAGLREQAALVADSVRKLHPEGEHLAQALDAAAAQVIAGGGAPSPELAMEVATGLLCLDAALADSDIAEASFGTRIHQLAERIAFACKGRTPGPIEPWMEDLYRRASDRQTMGSVVQELRASLAEVEGQLDKFHRNPAERDLLVPVPAKLAAMRGVLSVLGLDHAGQAVLRMRDEVDAVLAPSSADTSDVAAAHALSDRLAANVGALGLLIDVLGVQPQLAKSMFRFDAASGQLETLMGRTRESPSSAPAAPAGALSTQVQSLAAAAADDAASKADVMRQLDELTHHAVASDERSVADAARAAHAALAHSDESGANAMRRDIAQAMSDFAAPPPAAAAPAAAVSSTATAEDDEMLGIFFEEAEEVIAGARASLEKLAGEPQHFESISTVRRAFHTLKGSSRMVGLKDFGEAAWACEQLYNARMAETVVQADPPLCSFSLNVLDELEGWIKALAAKNAGGYQSAPIVEAAHALRDGVDPDARFVRPQAPAAAVPPPPRSPELAFEPEPEPQEHREAGDTQIPEMDPFAPAAVADLHASSPAPHSASDDEHMPTVPMDAPTVVQTMAHAPEHAAPDFRFDLGNLDEPADEPAQPVAPIPAPPADDADNYKVVGPLRIGLGLFNIFVNEADEQSRRLCTALAEWVMEVPRPVGEDTIALAHSLAGNSATVGYTELSALARRLEHALEASQSHEVAPDEVQLYSDVAEEIRRLLHQFAAGFLPSPAAPLIARFDAFQGSRQAQAAQATHDETVRRAREAEAAASLDEQDFAQPRIATPEVIESPVPVAAPPESGLGAVRFSVLDDAARPETGEPTGEPHEVVEPQGAATGFARDLDARDAIDPDLFDIFSEEAQELIPALAAHLRAWEQSPETPSEAFGALRALHTLKGSARLAGAMRLGELAHRLESAVEERVGGRCANPPTMAMLHTGADALDEEFQRLRRAPRTPAPAPLAPPPVLDTIIEPAGPAHPMALPTVPEPDDGSTVPGASPGAARTVIDWSRFRAAANTARDPGAAEAAAGNAAGATVRVKAPLLDRLVNQAGEVSITRSRLEGEVGQMRASLRELTENLDRLRHQLRDIELQADTQIASRLEASKSSSVDFDPLEMDRFTRFQELTRMMAESVNDVATVQRSIAQTVQSAEDEMAAQRRLTRALSEDLLRARMVPFDTLSERLYRVVRQAAKEIGVQVRLNVEGSSIELDRSVLDRIAGTLEHLLRNAVVHGIEPPEMRRAQDKDPVGTITVALTQQGNEVRIQIRDDGQGLDLQRIEARGRRNGLIAAQAKPSDAELANLIFTPGFTTTDEVTELAGRGVGMDAVRTDVTALGGRIETASAPGRGTAFTLLLPLTTAVTRVVQLRCGDFTVAMPASLVEAVRRLANAEVEQAYRSGTYRDDGHELPFFWLGSLLQASPQGTLTGKTASVVLVRSAEQRIALHVDEVMGNQEVVVKNLGPQLARLPGLAGMSLLPSGQVVPIYNPVALAAVYGQRSGGAARQVPAAVEAAPAVKAPLVLVVDDSLTVRRVTQRLLVREGFRVAVAKDGLDALEQLQAERPAVMLTDIEMPRMDGFDLLRNVRHDARWQGLPVIMITSRIAQKHRDLAFQLGVDQYLGKPYDEDQLIAMIRDNVARTAPA